MVARYWLLKAEPDSRIVKGKDVKFSVDDFESVKTSPWEGVRNYEARNLMKEMKLGEKAVFYHSNCKNPGVAGFAEVSKEAYPDYTAWDPSHPYFDAKSSSENPKWFMVDLTFVSRAEHFVSLALLRHIADSPALPPEVDYIGDNGFKALKTMDLVRRGRLSVQRVDETAWEALNLLASKGGWESMELKATASSKISSEPPQPPATRRARGAPRKKSSAKKLIVARDDDEDEFLDEDEESEDEYDGAGDGGDDDDEYKDSSRSSGKKKGASGRGRKRKSKNDSDEEYGTPRRKKKR